MSRSSIVVDTRVFDSFSHLRTSKGLNSSDLLSHLLSNQRGDEDAIQAVLRAFSRDIEGYLPASQRSDWDLLMDNLYTYLIQVREGKKRVSDLNEALCKTV